MAVLGYLAKLKRDLWLAFGAQELIKGLWNSLALFTKN